MSTLEPAKMAELTDGTLLCRWNVWALSQLVDDPYVAINGQLVIESFENFSLMGMLRLQRAVPSSVMRESFHFQQQCMPFRLGGIIVAHPPVFLSFMWAIVRP